MDDGKQSQPNKKRKQRPERDSKKMKKGTCWKCGKPGHFKNECRSKKKEKEEAKESNFAAVISEINTLEDVSEWWIDSGATRHVCNNRNSFTTYKPVEEGIVLYMGNSSSANVKGIGKVDLNFTSGKTVTLNDVYHVPEIRKNLVFGGLLNKHGFKLVFVSDKFVLTKGGTFVGKGYYCNGMFKMNINNKANIYAYIVDSLSLWHACLGHVNTRK